MVFSCFLLLDCICGDQMAHHRARGVQGPQKWDTLETRVGWLNRRHMGESLGRKAEMT